MGHSLLRGLGMTNIKKVYCLSIITDTPSILVQSPDAQAQGSQINYAVCQAWVSLYDDEGGNADVVHVPFGEELGCDTKLSAIVSYVVDTTSNSYVLNWRPNDIGEGLQLSIKWVYIGKLSGSGMKTRVTWLNISNNQVNVSHAFCVTVTLEA